MNCFTCSKRKVRSSPISKDPLTEKQKYQYSSQGHLIWHSDQCCPVLEFTAREAPRVEQGWNMSLSQNKIAVCTAKGDFHRSPNPTVPNLWQQSFSITFYFSSWWPLISCPLPPPSSFFFFFFAQQHKGWTGKARTYILWISPAPCPHLTRVHFPLGTRHSSPQCRNTKPQLFSSICQDLFFLSSFQQHRFYNSCLATESFFQSFAALHSAS